MFKCIEGREREWHKLKESNENDSYSRAVVTFAEDWATAVEKVYADSGSIALDEAIENSMPRARGMSGFQVAAAIATLARVWVFGWAIQRWWNRKNNAPDFNGIVDPTAMTLP